MKSVAVIGGGISGLSIAQCLQNRYHVKVFEKESKAGGLIRCYRVNGHLYHRVGGHVFNSRRQDVLDWFWNFFNREDEFVKATRNATIAIPGGRMIGYPIENHVYQLEADVMKRFIGDILAIEKAGEIPVSNFEEFLLSRFGKTLYDLYFGPYNEKIWRKDLKKIPLSWLEGKLPMPTVAEMIYSNINHARETSMVHSSFYYARQNGSQFLADRLAEGLNIVYDSKIEGVQKTGNKWYIAGEEFDRIIFCGNIKELPQILSSSIDLSAFTNDLAELEFHGTTSVLCEIDENPYSWVYMPGREHQSHRIICTGNFSNSNNNGNKYSATIEFTDSISEQDIFENLKKIPFNPVYITHHYTAYTYPIQHVTTREMVQAIKNVTEQSGVYLLGRFAEWEYYNMDAAMGAALDLNKRV